MVFEFVRACGWHLAWHVRVTLPVVHVHARMDARMRAWMHACASVLVVCAQKLTLLSAVTAS